MARVYLVCVLLCALVPLQGWAQAPSPPPLVPAPSSPEVDPDDPRDEPTAENPSGGYEGNEPPRREFIPRRWESAENERLMFPRIAVETLAGGVLGIVGAIPGTLYLASFSFCDECSIDDSALFLSLGLAAVGLTGGVALGVKAGGSLLGGEGRFLPTLLGSTLGFVGGVAAAFPLGAAFEGGWLVSLFVFPVTGAVIAYELSNASALESRFVAGTQVGWIPVISVRPSGGVVAGLAGHF